MLRNTSFRFIIFFLVLLGFSWAVSCATSPTGRNQVILVNDQDMIKMGQKAFADIKAQTSIETGSAVNAYVKCVANAIVRVADDPTEVGSWEVVVFRDSTPNAFALPGGKIGVHTGIFRVAKNADQLAAVLGHEVGHVIARHSHERVSQQMGMESGLSLLEGFLGGEHRELILGAIGVGAQYGVLLPFSRTHESEADEIGQMLMAQAGFDPKESVILWKNMSEMSGGNEPMEIMSTHPSSSSRIKDLTDGLQTTLPIYIHKRDAGQLAACKAP